MPRNEAPHGPRKNVCGVCRGKKVGCIHGETGPGMHGTGKTRVVRGAGGKAEREEIRVLCYGRCYNCDGTGYTD